MIKTRIDDRVTLTTPNHNYFLNRQKAKIGLATVKKKKSITYQRIIEDFALGQNHRQKFALISMQFAFLFQELQLTFDFTKYFALDKTFFYFNYKITLKI